MIRKTEKLYRRTIKGLISQHSEKVRQTTWWFLFIPIYRTEEILASGL